MSYPIVISEFNNHQFYPVFPMTEDAWNISDDLFDAAFHDIETGLVRRNPVLFEQERNGIIDLIPLFGVVIDELRPAFEFVCFALSRFINFN